MKVCIIGIGAMGCLFAARLTDLAEVLLIGHWKEQLAAISGKGLLMLHHDGSQTRHSVVASEKTFEHNSFDIVLVLVKGWQSPQAAKLSNHLLRKDGLAVTLQNGLGNLEILATGVGQERAVQGVTSEGATLVEPGVVRHAGEGLTYLARTEKSDRPLTKLVTLFQEAGFDTHLIDSADTLIWGKLAVNSGINPLTGLLQVSNGFLATHVVARRIMGLAAKETETVATAQNIVLPYANAAEQALIVAKATASNRSSMAQDVARMAPTEIDSICGAVARFGRKWQIPTPVNLALLQLVKHQVKHGSWLEEIDHLPHEIQHQFRDLALEIQESKQ